MQRQFQFIIAILVVFAAGCGAKHKATSSRTIVLHGGGEGIAAQKRSPVLPAVVVEKPDAKASCVALVVVNGKAKTEPTVGSNCQVFFVDNVDSPAAQVAVERFLAALRR